ncbi:MAG: ABC transporter permease [Gemmatimonadota bacterium]
MRIRFALSLARREARYGLRRVGAYTLSITLGVAALVAVHSFREDVARSVREEADVLMGANARLSSRRPFPDSVQRVVDSLAAAGVGVARVTTTSSMVLAPATGVVRLLQVQAADSAFPFYGEVETRPRGVWRKGRGTGGLLADPAVLDQLGVGVGDTLLVGRLRFRVAGVVEELPTEVGFQAALAPRVYLSPDAMERAGLLGFGSLARYQVFLRMADPEERRALRQRYEDAWEEAQVSFTLAEEQAQSVANGVRFLGRFLSLVGLGALLLGGLGVASAINVYIRERRPGVAVLRCVGARQSELFLAYLLQAGGLGLLGSLLGVGVGMAVQQALPGLLREVLPVVVSPRLSPVSALAGLGIGVWVALIFAILPLLQIRRVSPLAALRQEYSEAGVRPFGLDRLAAVVALVVSVLLLARLEAPGPRLGWAFAAAITGVAGLLLAVGFALTRAARHVLPRWASYPVRQGVSNLFRPRNQTLAVTLALGLGAFIVGFVLQVQSSLLRDLSFSFGTGRPNVLLFDVQPDQVEGVLELLPASLRDDAVATPLLPSRIAAINGRTPEELRADTTLAERRPEAWALRREYRNTYRDELGDAERVVAGRWWAPSSPSSGPRGREAGMEEEEERLPGVSMEVDIARDLGVGLGDTITWRIAGGEFSTVVTSLRRVEWDRLEPNFFAVLEPGRVAAAPHTFVVLARIADEGERAAFQRRLVGAFPNVSALDFSRVQEAVDTILSRVRDAVVFLGIFSAVAGLIVLAGALGTSRTQRVRESGLLRTLGARRGQIRAILITEYVALGTLASGTGLLLALAAAWLAVPRTFQVSFAPDLGAMGVIWGTVVALTVGVGFLGSREVLRAPPLTVLRETPE